MDETFFAIEDCIKARAWTVEIMLDTKMAPHYEAAGTGFNVNTREKGRGKREEKIYARWLMIVVHKCSAE